ncbi:MAG TPA: peptidoglycan-binding protein [Solirubrobacteraceae bacterium]|nr:peptidoglycan-binding protein [Solirubrobacteraceae bacterium]
MSYSDLGRVRRLALVAPFGASVLAALALAAPAWAGSSGGISASAGATSSTSSKSTFATVGPGHLGYRTLRKGMTGHDVRILQDFLTRAGYPTSIAGVFGPTTLANVKAFERAHGLPADGVVSKTVAAVLRAAVAKAEKAYAGPAGRAHLNSDGTVTPPANAPAVIRNVIAAANRIAFKPYIYGGGHGSWNDSGYDCSGSVSYALHGGNLISAPEDSGELESYGSAGAGRWITIWANAGHTYMYVAGLRFDTSAQGETGGSRWTSTPRSNGGFVERHPTGL